MDSDRIGHMCLLDYFFARETISKKNFIYIIASKKKSANNQLLKIYKEKFLISHSYSFIFWLNQAINYWIKKNNITDKLSIKDIKYTKDTKKIFFINNRESFIYEKLLENLGLDPKKKTICIHNRDQYYLKIKYPKINFDHHKNRNFKINDLLPAAKLFYKNNYNVLRIGKFVEEPILSNYVCDYPQSKYRSDFNDLLIAENSFLYFGSDSGIFSLFPLFRKPFSFLNFPNLHSIFNNYFWNKFPSIFQIIVDGRTKNPLSLNEIFKNNFDKLVTNNDFKINGLELRNNSISDIELLSQDILNMLNNDYNNREQIKIFYEILKSFQKNNENFSNDLISNSFLKNNSYLLR